MKRIVLASFAVLFAAGTASADIIDIGPFGGNIGSVGGATGSDIYAQKFLMPAENMMLEFGMYLNGGGETPPAVRIDIWGVDGDGYADETNVIIAGTTYQELFNDLTLVTTLTNTELVAGAEYFVVINGTIDQESNGSYGSSWSSDHDPYPDGWATWSNDMGSSWSSSGRDSGNDWAFYIRTGPVPAPGAIALLGLSAFGIRKRRR